MGGRVAHGDLTGAGGAGGFATKVGLSGAPLSTRPLPDAKTPGFTDGEAVALVGVGAAGAGDFGFG